MASSKLRPPLTEFILIDTAPLRNDTYRADSNYGNTS